ncbi:hypothetical protein KCA24_20230, partial [Escherichia coli]|nr:hypothetical protein [Escherichia coli]
PRGKNIYSATLGGPQISKTEYFVYAGFGLNALSGLQGPKESVNCNTHCRPDKRSASGNFSLVITFEINLTINASPSRPVAP